jgi:hypothetical protein
VNRIDWSAFGIFTAPIIFIMREKKVKWCCVRKGERFDMTRGQEVDE